MQLRRARRSWSFASRLLLWCCLLVSALCIGALAISAAAAQDVQIPQPAPDKQAQIDRLIVRAQSEGQIRVLAKLALAYRAESTLTNAQIEAQHAQIVQVQDQLLQDLSGTSARIAARFRYIPFMSLVVGVDGLEALSRSSHILEVDEVGLTMPTLSESVSLIGAPAVWSTTQGSGQTIAVLDTGIDRTKLFFQGRVTAEACFSNPDGDPNASSMCPNHQAQQTGIGAAFYDACIKDIYGHYAPFGCEHGYNVAGIASGSVSGDDLWQGVAPESDIVAVDVFHRIDSLAECDPYPEDGFDIYACVGSRHDDILLGLEYLIGSFPNLAAINLSLGDPNFVAGDAETCRNHNPTAYDAYKYLIDQFRANGIATVIAAGNDGSVVGVGFPACISTAVTVGATTSSDVVADFSNSDYGVDVLAPGVNITSAAPDNDYSTLSGTSQATPHVAGAWALLRAAVPNATWTDILTALESTGMPVTDSRNGITRSRINVFEALGWLQSHIETPTPMPTQPAHGTLTVTTLSDTGLGSLRQAVLDASSGDTLQFAVTGTINLGSPLIVDKNLTIVGPGGAGITLNGSLTVTGQLSLYGQLTWTGGTLTGAGTTYVEPGATLAISGSATKYLRGGHTLRNAGTITWSGVYMEIHENALIDNLAGGLFDVQGNPQIYDSTSDVGTEGTINNAGIFRKSSGGGQTFIESDIAFNNTGQVDIQSGSFSVWNGTTSGVVQFAISAGATLDLASYGVADGSAIFVAGGGSLIARTVTFGGTATIFGAMRHVSGTTVVSGDLTVTGGISQEGGTLQVDGSLTVSGSSSWTNGIFTGVGVTEITAGSTMTATGTGTKYLRGGHTLRNAGTFIWSGEYLDFDNNAVIDNLAGGLFDIQGNLSVYDAGADGALEGAINNAGIFRKSSGGGTSWMEGDVAFNNSGTVDLQSGSFLVSAGTTSGAVSFALNTGSTLDLTVYTVADGSVITVTGGGSLVTRAVTFNGTATVVGAMRHLSAVSAVSGDLTVMGGVSQEGGTLQVDGSLTVSGSSSWTSGIITGSGLTEVSSGSTLTMNGSSALYLRGGQTLRNAGTVTWTGGSIDFDNLSVIDNLPGALFDLQGNMSIADSPSDSAVEGVFTNGGTFRKSSGTATSLVEGDIEFHNAGRVEVLTGTFYIANYIQEGGTIAPLGGTVTIPGTLNLTTGVLSGTSTFNASVISSATVSPGASPGILTINGSYTQNPGGSLMIEIGGAPGGSGYDRLVVTGSAALAGTLNLSVINGYLPNIGDTFQIMQYASHTGQFDTITGSSIAADRAFDVSYQAAGVFLTVVEIPTAELDGTVQAQGRPGAPDERWVMALHVTVTADGSGTVVFDDMVTTDDYGAFTIPGLPPGTYRIRAKGSHTLAVAQTVSLAVGVNSISLGMLREGDANDSNSVTIADFAILAAAFGTTSGSPMYDARADFNGDNAITILDFSLLAANFGQVGAP